MGTGRKVVREDEGEMTLGKNTRHLRCPMRLAGRAEKIREKYFLEESLEVVVGHCACRVHVGLGHVQG